MSKQPIKSESRAPFEIVSFSKFKNVAPIDPSPKSSGNPFDVLCNIIDYSLYPLYAFDPVEDVKQISTITKKRIKNQEKRRQFQIEYLENLDLKKSTIYQCFEPVSQCFIYDQSIRFPETVSFLSIGNDTIAKLIPMLRSDSGKGKPYSMPGFLAFASGIRKIESNPAFHFGAMAKRLTYHHSIPISDKPIANYLKCFYQAMVLLGHISKMIKVNEMLDYFFSWESNAPTILDYRCFLISKIPDLRANILTHFRDSLAKYDDHDPSGPSDIMINIFRGFVMVPKMMYKGESHVGFLSTRWFAPLQLSTFSGGIDLIHFDSDIVRESMQPPQSEVPLHKKTFNPKMKTDQTDNIHFSPPFDFNDQHLEVNISDKLSNHQNDLTIGQQQFYVKMRKRILKKIKDYLKLDTIAKPSDPFFDDSFLLSFNNFYSQDLAIPFKISDQHRFDLSIFHGEVLHQWARDIAYIETMQFYFKESSAQPQDFAFAHEKIIKPVLTNEFDHANLHQEEVFTTFFPDAVLPIKRNHSRVPVNADDIMYLYFLLLDHIYKSIIRKDSLDDPDTNIIYYIQKMKPSTVIRWLVIWLSIHSIQYQSGYSEQLNRNNEFNCTMLPILYKWRALPIKKSEKLKPNSFDKNTGFDTDYIWFSTQTPLKGVEAYLHNQISLATLMIFKHIFMAVQSNNMILTNDFNPKRFSTFGMTQNDIYQLIKSSRDYLPSNPELQKILNFNRFVSLTDFPMTEILLLIDFYLACLNQYGSFLSFLIPKGNKFYHDIETYSMDFSGMRKKSGANHSVTLETLTQGLEEFPDDDLGFYIEDIFNPPEIADIPKPYWLFANNPNLENLDMSLKDLKSALNNQIQPNPYFIDVQAHSLAHYPKDRNKDIKNDGLPFLEMIIDNFKYMINNDYDIELQQARERKIQINNYLRSFLEIYFIPAESTQYAWEKNIVFYFERVKVADLRDIEIRKKKMYRFIFIREYVKNQTVIVEDFYRILEMMRFDSVIQDTDNIVDRLQYSLYTANNFVNRELPMSLFREYEVLQKTITLDQIQGLRFRDYLIERKTILSLRNFRYLFKSMISGKERQNFPRFPTIQVEWTIFIKNKLGEVLKPNVYYSEIQIDPYDFTLEESRSYKIHYPHFYESEIKYLEANRNCVIYSELNLILQKTELPDFILNRYNTSRIVVYHPLSLPGTKISILGQDALEISAGNLFERIQRFNNFTFLNQPDRLRFLRAHITQSVI